MSNVVIDIAAEFTGKKAFKQADTAAAKLTKSVKGVAAAFGVSFGAAALARYGQNAVKAFAEDEKAATKLAKAVDNLGLGFENTAITKFISDLEKSAGVADDLLRPAFQSIISTTGSFAKSQEMLALALDISAGSGEDVVQVSKDLNLAYLGQTKGLAKYYTGLTKTELATMSYAEIQAVLSKEFSGQNAARLETYAGKMDALNVAIGNVSESIGQGLIDSFIILAGNDGIGAATDSLEQFGETARDVLTGTASYLDKILEKFSPDAGGIDWVSLIPVLGGYLGKGGVLDALAAEGRKVTGRDKQYGGIYATQYNNQKSAADEKIRAQREKERIAREKEMAALLKKNSLAEKNKLSLTKAAAIFDLNKIQIAAALKNTYDIQEKTRLEALMAIENEDGALAIKKIQELQTLQENADMRKLMGIQAISDETLSALNNQLMAELRNINASTLAEAEKDDMRNIAFGKYNAALAQAGDLMEKSYYTERVQIQLTEIAKMAAASNSVNAMITLERLRETTSLDVISKIREKQSEADKERMKALEDYIEKLRTLGGIGVGLGGASDDSIKTLVLATEAELGALKQEQDAIDAMNRAQALLDNLYNLAGGIPSSGKLGANVNATDFFNSLSNMNQTSFGGYSPSMNSGAGGSVPSQVNYVTVNTAAVGSEDFLARTIQQVIQDINRNGSSTTWAGSISS
jgi:hypothetical protein